MQADIYLYADPRTAEVIAWQWFDYLTVWTFYLIDWYTVATLLTYPLVNTMHPFSFRLNIAKRFLVQL